LASGGPTAAARPARLDADGRITTVHNVANPDKLQAIADGTARDVGTW